MKKRSIVYIDEKDPRVQYVLSQQDILDGYIIVLGTQDRNISLEFILHEASQANIRILCMAKGQMSVVVHTLQHHIGKNATSTVFVKSVVRDDASFMFDGKIIIDPGADKTNAYQRNENLILSEGARAITKPTLEILANDVRCTHGAATGDIPADQIWYLKTRGLTEKKAREAYVHGFFHSMLTDLLEYESEKIVHRIIRI